QNHGTASALSSSLPFPSLLSSLALNLHTNPSPPLPTLIYSARLPFASRVLGLSSLQSGASLSALPLCFSPSSLAW
ncbi:hypothetical protein IWX49DRAFT_530364, partial [Phyllosticta citricarpa]